MTQHGHAVRPYSPTYRSWLMMRARCQCVNTPAYQKYGARGITVCTRWDDFSLFLKDMGERPSLAYSLDRIDGERGYEPSNCRWATKSEQALNRRSTRAVICSDGRQFSSLKEAADAVAGNRHCIWDVCNGNQKTHLGPLMEIRNMIGRPISFFWDGEVMKPLHPRIADREYIVGERYTLTPFEERSAASHKHEFAWLYEAWQSLPEHLAERFPTAEHLRKFALIRAGYSDSHTITCKSKAEALRVAAFIRPIDEFAVVVTQEATVTRFTAKSQSRRAMGAKEFQQSKEKIMEVVARMIGVEPSELPQARAA